MGNTDTRFDDIDKNATQMESDLANQYGVLQPDGTYKGGMIGNSQQAYNDLIEQSKSWAEEQKKIQNQQTDFAIQKIEQQKAQAKQDFGKEKTSAYVDWQKQSNPYGANAEQMAAMGMGGTGYAESSQVKMYVTYQNRVATAREVLNRAILEYDNQMTQARLQNSAALAEIAATALKEQLELALSGMQYQNSLISDLTDKKMAVTEYKQSAYMDLYDQINKENSLALEREKFNYEKELAERELALKEQQIKATLDAKGYTANGTKKASTRAASNAKKNATITVKNSGIEKAAPKKETTNTSSSSPEIDMDSVLALGLGPISASTLNNLVEQGVVKEQVVNGKIIFMYTASGLKQKQLYSRLG